MSSMGMNKSGTEAITANQWTTLTSFVIRAGFPATVISGGNTLVMDANALGTIRFRGNFTSIGGTQQFRVRLNGTQLLTVNTATIGTVDVTVSAGDTIDLQGFASSFLQRTVAAGATETWVEFIPKIEAGTTVGVGWEVEAAAAADRPTGTDIGIGYSIDADVHVAADADAEVTVGWGWSVEAAVAWTPGAGIPLAGGPTDISIGVRTVDGRPVGRVACDETTDIVWSRDRSQVTRAEIQTFDIDAGDLIPWLHWIDLYEDGEKVWSGSIHEVSTELVTGATRIDARDVGGFQWYTRVPTTRSWQRLDLAPIAADLWQAMLDLHGIDARPIVLPALSEERYDYSTTTDSKMLHQAMDELVQRGLDWTVVAGRPILGTPPDVVVAELDECDFMVGLRRVRSGKRTANDVRVQGQNWAHTERIEMAGLHLQAMWSLDNMRGASNVTAAARQYLRDIGAIRDMLEVPSGASLHPEAPIKTSDLVPGNVFVVHASSAGLSTRMRLKTVEVAWSAGARDVRVTLDAIARPIELGGAAG
ncbi:hypothetical protein [Nocardia sp. CA-290969]|uniref:hypothetical protein n=1 Tax=Nocardia sp. CA-290969 TaxID=3239986 RepID=UPI003D923A48